MLRKALVLVLALAVLAIPSPAHAATYKRVTIRVDSWGKVIKVSVPSFPVPETFRMRVTFSTLYYFWPHRRGQYLAVYKQNACYTFLDGKKPSLLFDGMKVHAGYHDDYWKIDQGQFVVTADGTQNCASRKISTQRRRWFPMSEAPFWTAEGSVVWSHYRDQGFHWSMDGGSHVRYFHPENDFIVQSTKIRGRWKIA